MNTGFEQVEISELWKMGKDAADQYKRTNDLFYRDILSKINAEIEGRSLGQEMFRVETDVKTDVPMAGPTRDTTAKRLRSIEAAEEAAAQAESARSARRGWLRGDPLGDISRASSTLTQPRVLQGAGALAAEMGPLWLGRHLMKAPGAPQAMGAWLTGTAAPTAAFYGGAAAHKVGQWLHPEHKEATPGWGTISDNPLDLFTSGTGAAGAGETEFKYAGLGQVVGQLMRGAGNAAGAKLLNIKQNRMGLGGRRYPPLTPADQKLADHFMEQAERAGVGDIMPTGPFAELSGATTTSAIYGALQKLPWIRSAAAKASEKAAKKAEELFLGSLLRHAPDGGSQYELSERLFEAVRNFSHRQLKGIDDLYKAAWGGAERLAGTTSPVRAHGIIDTANEILRGTGVRTIVDGVPGRMSADITEDVLKTVKNYSIVQPKLTLKEIKDLHFDIRGKLENLKPSDAGFKELRQLDEAVTAARDDFIQRADSLYGEGATNVIGGAFKSADDTYRTFSDLLKTPQARWMQQAEGNIFQSRYARAFPITSSRTGAADGARIQRTAEGAFSAGGEKQIDQLLDSAMLLDSPDFVKGIRNIIDDPKTWNEIVRGRLTKAVQDAIGDPVLSQTLLDPRKFNPARFYKSLGLHEGDDVLEEFLKGTGHSVKDVKAFAEVSALLPRDDSMGQMMLRRVMLGGTKGVTSLSPLALIVSAAAGGAAVGGAGGFISFTAAVATLVGMKKFVNVLSRPDLLKRFTTYGRSEAAWRAGKLSNNARKAQYATFLHTIGEALAPDDKEEQRAFTSNMMDLVVAGSGLIPDVFSPASYGEEGKVFSWMRREGETPVPMEHLTRDALDELWKIYQPR